MKKIKIKIIIVFILLLFPLSIKALNVDPELTCDSVILEDNKEAVCTYLLKITDGSISALSSKYTFESDYVVVQVEKEGSWQGNSDLNKVDYYDYNDYTGEVIVAKVIVKKKEGLKLKEDKITKLGFNLVEIGESDGKANKYNILTEHSFTIEKEEVKTTVSTTTKPTTTTKEPTTSSTTSSTITTTTSTTTTNKQVFNNPSTLDNIVVYISVFCLSINIMLIMLFCIKKKNRQDL